MTDSFLIFSPCPPSINFMTSWGKQNEWKNINSDLQKVLENYKKNDLEHQEKIFFDFLEKNLEDMTPSNLYKIIKKLMEKITDEMRENGIKTGPVIFNKSGNSFNLNFSNILSLSNIIIYIIENISSKGKTSDIIYDFVYKGKIPPYKDNKMIGQEISKVIKAFDNVETLNICLYTNNKDNYNFHKKKEKQNKLNYFYMDIKIVFFFGLFYKSFFNRVNTINFDLNIYPIDNCYINNANPYLINEENILMNGEEYKDIILCNLILIKTLQKFNYIPMNFIMYDSYQIELHNILTNVFNNVNNEDNNEIRERKLTLSGQKIKNYFDVKNNYYNIRKRTISATLEENPLYLYSPKFNNNYLYFQHLLNFKQNTIFDISFNFNSLDPLLFTSINYVLIHFTCISKLNLGLFPPVKFNKRKTLINNFFYNKYSSNEHANNTYSTDDTKIYYQYLDNTNNTNKNNFILKDEKLLNELFTLFNYNLIVLSIILEKKITELLTLSIDFSTYNNDSISLCNYDNYNCSIVCFIFDLFKILQTQKKNCKIKSLNILYDDFLDEKSYIVETIKRKIPSWNESFKLNELKINNINFNISNISLILPFENFPSAYLTELIISNLSYNDLNNMVNAFKNNKDIFPVLVKLDISLGIFVEDYKPPLEILLTECLPNKLSYFFLNIPFNINMKDLIDILYWIKLNKNCETKIEIKILNNDLSRCINKKYFINIVTNLFYENENAKYLKYKNLLLDYKSRDNKVINFGINKYQIKDLNYYYNIIFCLQKINDRLKNVENINIFQNIFNFRGNFKKYNVDVEINE